MKRRIQLQMAIDAVRENLEFFDLPYKEGEENFDYLTAENTDRPVCYTFSFHDVNFIHIIFDEEQFMNTDQALNLYTQGFFNAFMAYKKRYNENITIPYEPDNTPVIEVPQVVPPTLEEPQPEPIPQVVPMKPAQPEPQPENVKPEQPAETKPVAEETAGMPVFKVQVTANSTKLKLNSPQFQGLEQVDYYQDGGMYKYTVGASTDYNAISQLRKQLLDRFPQAFVIAFKNGKRCDVQQAIQEFKQNRKKR